MLRFIFNTILELAPIFVAIIALPLYGFEISIVLLVITTVISVGLLYLLEGRIPRFGLFGALSVVLVGGITVYTDNPSYIILLDSVSAFGFAALLLVGKYAGKVSILKYFFSAYFSITDKGWNILTLRWSVLFILLGLGNEYVRLFRTPEEWVVWNGLAAVFAAGFGMYQFTLSRRERLPEASTWGLRRGVV
jgi:intracellular septation protein